MNFSMSVASLSARKAATAWDLPCSTARNSWMLRRMSWMACLRMAAFSHVCSTEDSVLTRTSSSLPCTAFNSERLCRNVLQANSRSTIRPASSTRRPRSSLARAISPFSSSARDISRRASSSRRSRAMASSRKRSERNCPSSRPEGNRALQAATWGSSRATAAPSASMRARRLSRRSRAASWPVRNSLSRPAREARLSSSASRSLVASARRGFRCAKRASTPRSTALTWKMPSRRRLISRLATARSRFAPRIFSRNPSVRPRNSSSVERSSDRASRSVWQRSRRESSGGSGCSGFTGASYRTICSHWAWRASRRDCASESCLRSASRSPTALESAASASRPRTASSARSVSAASRRLFFSASAWANLRRSSSASWRALRMPACCSWAERSAASRSERLARRASRREAWACSLPAAASSMALRCASSSRASRSDSARARWAAARSASVSCLAASAWAMASRSPFSKRSASCSAWMRASRDWPTFSSTSAPIRVARSSASLWMSGWAGAPNMSRAWASRMRRISASAAASCPEPPSWANAARRAASPSPGGKAHTAAS
ncbi:hypothetical protein NNJEOMEG_00132 [Fundidesulfovibrio magnetotacticus]|uniref:Uncharacterized protein n=1 Tax=Fundidesulfovibrio magnetotacticus TaxID=2730080 RepID=A0A6V8LQA2_9BACT|nr:hypothetical protein NNJEOMEG_00132 [Fundidesulfovibrio magnetotacticus]